MAKEIRCTFKLTEKEAKTLCELRDEPKPSTAAAQVIRGYIKAKTK